MKRRELILMAGLSCLPMLGKAQSRSTLSDKIESGILSLHEKVEESRAALSRMSSLKQAVIELKDPQALKELQELAARQNISAMLFIGCLFDQGLGGVRQDSYRGAQYFHAAAKLGDNIALYNLGLIFLKGRGIKANEAVAINYFQLAARSRVRHASVVLGNLYEGKRDYYNARQYFQQASGSRIHDEATYKHGLYVFRGISGDRNTREGILLLEKAADTWHPQAMMALIEIHANGLGGTVNYGTAAKWYEVLMRNHRPYDKKLTSSIIPRNVLNESELESVRRAAQIWIDAHQTPVTPADYEKTIWEM